MVHACHPSYTGSTNRRIMVQAGIGIKQDPISKITDTKMTQVVECLPTKHEGPEFKSPVLPQRSI
jgi:hypothetical protein